MRVGCVMVVLWLLMLPFGEKSKKHIDKEKNLLICGHSLGGALAELSAAKLYKSHPQLSLVTFGKPNTFFQRV